MPIQFLLFKDRFEVRSPGGLYGRLRAGQPGKVQPGTRNPVLAVAMELLGETKNRYSGIPIMRRESAKAGMPEPEFREEQGTFVACFLRAAQELKPHGTEPITEKPGGTAEKNLLYFCGVPRTR